MDYTVRLFSPNADRHAGTRPANRPQCRTTRHVAGNPARRAGRHDPADGGKRTESLRMRRADRFHPPALRPASILRKCPILRRESGGIVNSTTGR